MKADLDEAINGSDGIILAVRQNPCPGLKTEEIVKTVGSPFAVINCFSILDDVKTEMFLN